MPEAEGYSYLYVFGYAGRGGGGRGEEKRGGKLEEGGLVLHANLGPDFKRSYISETIKARPISCYTKLTNHTPSIGIGFRALGQHIRETTGCRQHLDYGQQEKAGKTRQERQEDIARVVLARVVA